MHTLGHSVKPSRTSSLTTYNMSVHTYPSLSLYLYNLSIYLSLSLYIYIYIYTHTYTHIYGVLADAEPLPHVALHPGALGNNNDNNK